MLGKKNQKNPGHLLLWLFKHLGEISLILTPIPLGTNGFSPISAEVCSACLEISWHPLFCGLCCLSLAADGEGLSGVGFTQGREAKPSRACCWLDGAGSVPAAMGLSRHSSRVRVTFQWHCGGVTTSHLGWVGSGGGCSLCSIHQGRGRAVQGGQGWPRSHSALQG